MIDLLISHTSISCIFQDKNIMLTNQHAKIIMLWLEIQNFKWSWKSGQKTTKDQK